MNTAGAGGGAIRGGGGAMGGGTGATGTCDPLSTCWVKVHTNTLRGCNRTFKEIFKSLQHQPASKK